ncbi:F-box family protein [Tripterygium wilfordii]|uniref:F-box family protein n=1 Tax=Tripterygium wilfordii TaxID=458696 RepID=A0A7J7CWQ9_TRIWF|nr:F-box family protein [Tripterygium wilfordii]
MAGSVEFDFQEMYEKEESKPLSPSQSSSRGSVVLEAEEVEMKWMKRKKKMRKREKGNEEEEQEKVVRKDPLEVLGWELMMMILNKLDARSVALSLLVSRCWYFVASSDRLWTSKCVELWLGKAHIPRLSQVRGLSKLAAYSSSIMDGKRSRITKDDMCDHAWEFHYQKAAPEYWRDLDPYWKGTGPLMRRYFHPDGSQTADSDDNLWGGHESCYSIVTSFVGEGMIREHYVRINRWPQMFVSRKDNWGWELANNLYFYSSVPDAYKEGGTGPLSLVI